MAGGKQSARQKMINLMYLVFISMLAMNMDKKVLTVFAEMNHSSAESNAAAKVALDEDLKTLKRNAEDKPDKWKDKYTRAKEMATVSDEFFNYISGIKEELVAKLDEKTKKNPEKQDSPDPINELFFKDGKESKKGAEFVEKVNEFRTKMEKLAPEAKEALTLKFNTNPIETEDGEKVAWLEEHFEGFPLIAVKTYLTKMQSDARSVESKAISVMVTGALVDDASMNKYKAIVAFDKSAYYPGETLKGRIVLGRYDNSMVPTDVTINGKSVKDKVQDGQVILDGIAVGGVGDHTLKGEFIYMEDGEPIPIPIETKYSVIPKPNSPVISADKMNVVYRGVANPITVSFPGISDNKISASAPGMTRKSGTSYVIRPKSGKTVKISATGTLPSGVKVSGFKVFRIKDIPNPVGTIRREAGLVSMPKSSLAKSTVGAELQDFDFDLKLRVKSFSFRVPGKPTITVSGSKLNGAAKSALSRAKAGQTVMIFNIKAAIVGNSVYQLKKVAPVTITLK